MTFCYEVRQLGSKRKLLPETVHLQNLNCLASLRTKVMPVRISSERNWRKSWLMYPSRDKQDANKSNLARTLELHLSCSKHGQTNKFRLACSRRRDFIPKLQSQSWKFRAITGGAGARPGTENSVAGTSFLKTSCSFAGKFNIAAPSNQLLSSTAPAVTSVRLAMQ